MTIPDFGVDRVEWNGLVLECRRVAPNLTLQDIINAYHEATKDCTPADSIAGNPARWPTTKGVKAIVDLLLTAIYEPQPTPIDNLTAALMALAQYNIPPDVQELLVHGNPDRNVPPGALQPALKAAKP